MLEWLAANAATIVISAVLIVLLALAIRYIVKKRKNGGCVGCEACSSSKGGCSACHGGCAAATDDHQESPRTCCHCADKPKE